MTQVCFPSVIVTELSYKHGWPVGVRQIYAPDLESVPDDQEHSPLRSASRRLAHQRVHHVLSQTVAKIILVRNLGFRQYH